MAKQRKTDKYRLLEGRGTGHGVGYKPWIMVHEFGSKGRVHRIPGWIHRRIYHLMSDLELYYFLIAQWNYDNVIDIREQFPLLPLEETELIAEEENIIHPPRSRKQKTVITTDFLLTITAGNSTKDVAIAIKYQKDLDDKRTQEKLKIENLYWDKKNIYWDVVTDLQIDKVVAKNIYFIYNRYFWCEYNGFSQEEANIIISDFIDNLIKNNYNVLKTTSEFDIKNCWELGESLNLFQFLLTRKIILTDFTKRINYHSMEIKVNHESRWNIE